MLGGHGVGCGGEEGGGVEVKGAVEPGAEEGVAVYPVISSWGRGAEADAVGGARWWWTKVFLHELVKSKPFSLRERSVRSHQSSSWCPAA